MKNRKIKIPTFLAFAQGILMSLFVCAIFAFLIAEGDPQKTWLFTLRIFTVAFTVMMLFGFLRIRVRSQRGALYADSLVVNDTTYAGTFAPYFILPALFSMDTYNKGAIYLKDGIKKQHTIGKLDFTRPLQRRQATPTTSGGDITIDGNVLNPQDVMVYQEFNPRDLEVHWEAESLSPTLLTRQLPPTIENYISLLIVGRAFEQYENCIWMGSTTYTAADGASGNGQLKWFDGLIKKFLADSSIYATGSPVTLTSSNIAGAFLDLYTAVATNNKALLANPQRYSRMKFLVSYTTWLLYEDYQSAQPYKNINVTQEGVYRYKSFEIVPLAGLPDNTIVFTEAFASTEGNIWLGMNSILDENFQLARLFNNSELFFYKMLMKMDVNYGFANKIFYYTTKVTADFSV